MNLGYVFILFLVLKMTGIITWSWWAVTAPIWIIPAFVGALIVIAIGLCILVALITLLVSILNR